MIELQCANCDHEWKSESSDDSCPTCECDGPHIGWVSVPPSAVVEKSYQEMEHEELLMSFLDSVALLNFDEWEGTERHALIFRIKAKKDEILRRMRKGD